LRGRLRAGEPWEKQATKIERGFARFWNADAHCLYDVLDGPHGTDASIRPNQILALSLPDSPLSASQRRAVLARCARDLATSHGLRSLSLDDPRHIESETGDAVHDARTAVMGSAWTWLLPHYALATLRVHGDRAAALELLEPLEGLMRGRGLGMLPERSDSARPHAGRGPACRAWAIAETLRAYRLLTGPRRDMRRRESTHAKDAALAKARRTAAARV
jgi:4-alpha-glucanotransferase